MFLLCQKCYATKLIVCFCPVHVNCDLLRNKKVLNVISYDLMIYCFVCLGSMEFYEKGKNVEKEESLPEDLLSSLPTNLTWWFLFILDNTMCPIYGLLIVQGQDSPSSIIIVFSTSRVFHWKTASQRLR